MLYISIEGSHSIVRACEALHGQTTANPFTPGRMSRRDTPTDFPSGQHERRDVSSERWLRCWFTKSCLGTTVTTTVRYSTTYHAHGGKQGQVRVAKSPRQLAPTNP